MNLKGKRTPSTAFASALSFVLLLALLHFRFLSGMIYKQDTLSSFVLESLATTNEFSVEELRSLSQVLHKAQFGDSKKTVILTHLNEAWAANGSIIDMFLGSFRDGLGTKELLDHLVIVAMDGPSFQRCVQVHKHCAVLKTKGVDFSGGQKSYMERDYLKMMWRRIQLLSAVLELGYSFVFSDTDVLWFRNPFHRFHPSADFEIACDRFNGNVTDMRNPVNGGFMHVVSSAKTIALYKLWYESRLKFPGRGNQYVFDVIKRSSKFKALELNVRLLSTKFFGGFCEKAKDLEVVCTMHATCCVGLEKKMRNLRLVAEDWNLFKLMTPDERQNFPITWRAPRNCTMKKAKKEL